MKEIKRDYYLDKLIRRKWNGSVKVITGIRRCGKSYLLFNLFYKHLIESGVNKDNIISLALDDVQNKEYHDAMKLYEYISSKITSGDEKYYVLLDELQFAIKKSEIKSDDSLEVYGVLNSLLRMGNVDIYVTGSNSRFLSTDVMTEFRGRGDQIKVYPLSFSEFYSACEGLSKQEALSEYFLYGGLPGILARNTTQDKEEYLLDLEKFTYMNDIIERYDLKGDNIIENLFDVLASGIGCLTNPNKLVNTFNSNNIKTTAVTINRYLDMLIDSFLISKVYRYDIRGREYINTPFKFYFTDMGIRNAKLNFRQYEETHIMENVIYNELLYRGFKVDVGVVKLDTTDKDGTKKRGQLEVDFVCNLGSKRYYIVSAYALPTREQEEALHFINSRNRIDSSKRVIITKEGRTPYYNDNGYLVMNIYDFLLNQDSLYF